MAVRRRQRVASERSALISAACYLLHMDGYRVRLGAGSSEQATERRAAVERALTSDELVMVEHLVRGDLPAEQDDALRDRIGPVDDEAVMAAQEQILARPAPDSRNHDRSTPVLERKD